MADSTGKVFKLRKCSYSECEHTCYNRRQMRVHYQASHSVDDAVHMCTSVLGYYTKSFKHRSVAPVVDKMKEWQTAQEERIASTQSSVVFPLQLKNYLSLLLILWTLKLVHRKIYQT